MNMKIEASEDSRDSGTGHFKCPDCQYICRSKASLNFHSAVHSEACAKTCNICGEIYSNEEDLAEHWANHETDSDLTCLSCNETFRTQAELDEHLKRHRLTCDTCPKVFANEEKLATHYKVAHQRETFQCNLCFAFFKTKFSLRGHKIQIHKSAGKSFICEICSYTFPTKYELSHHFQRHIETKRFKCTLCSKAYRFKNALTAHLLKHAGETPYQCLICLKSFSDRQHFLKHGKEHLFFPGEGVTCLTCGKEFINKSRLKFHMRVHSNQRPYVCKQCGVGFKYSGHLKAHAVTHTEPLQCSSCPKVCPTTQALERHSLIHKTKTKQLELDTISPFQTVSKKRPKEKRKENPKKNPKEKRKEVPKETFLQEFGPVEGKPHQCELCGMSYKFPHRLKMHLYSHLRTRQ